jgi:hypothetical protein
VLIATALSAIVMTAVLATNLHIMRSGVRITHYAEMSTQVRRGLEQLGHDLRIASGITWNNTSDLTLTLPNADGTTRQVTYAWTAATQSLYSVPGTSSAATAGRVYLINGIPPLAGGSAGLTFARFDRNGNAATTDLATKRVQVLLNGVRQSSTMAAATDTAVSASFVLRNKPAS